MNDFKQFLSTTTGRVLSVIVLLAIGFFSGMEYKTYQIKQTIADSVLPALNSINDSRIKGDDATVKANVSNLRAQMEIYFTGTGNNSYTGACSDSDVLALLNSAENASSGEYFCNISSDGSNYAIAVPLKSDSNISSCVDSTGLNITINKPLGSSTACK